MTDSGSVVSVVPPSPHERQHTDAKECFLHAANGSITKTFGTKMDMFTIMGRRCTHMMIVADVTCQIFGIDFFSESFCDCCCPQMPQGQGHILFNKWIHQTPVRQYIQS